MRKLDVKTLEGAAKHYAGEWMRPDRKSPSGKRFIGGQAYVLQDFWNFTFKDEFEFMVSGVKGWLGSKAVAEFEKAAKEKFSPREDKVFAELLKERLAIDPKGNHIEGQIGKVEIARNRIVGYRPYLERRPICKPVDPGNLAGEWKIVGYREYSRVVTDYWPIYAGENEERDAGRIRKKVGEGPGADPFPEFTTYSPQQQATVPNISAALAVKLADIIDVEFNIGDAAANIRGRTGAQPADPDASETGTLLFTLAMSDPAFAGAADDSPGGLITADTITDDSSADATDTLGYCRCAATGNGADDVLDGEAGTSGADFNMNTLSIVSGSTVSMTSFTILVPQGSTAT